MNRRAVLRYRWISKRELKDMDHVVIDPLAPPGYESQKENWKSHSINSCIPFTSASWMNLKKRIESGWVRWAHSLRTRWGISKRELKGRVTERHDPDVVAEFQNLKKRIERCFHACGPSPRTSYPNLKKRIESSVLLACSWLQSRYLGISKRELKDAHGYSPISYDTTA